MLSARSTIRVNLFSSTAYEISRFLHNSMLFMVLPLSEYGKIGSIFSLIYLAAHIGECGGGSAFVPVMEHVLQTRNRFYQLVVFPQTALLLLTAICTHAFFTPYFSNDRVIILAAILLTTTEGVRMTLRTLLHASGYARRVVVAELCTTASYFIFIWGGYALSAFSLHTRTIFLPFLIVSLATTFYFLGLMEGSYGEHEKQSPEPLSYREIIVSRATIMLLHLPQTLFSSNFLVPFFAIHSGLACGGIAKITSEIAATIKAVARATVGFSGVALFKANKDNLQKMREVFKLLWKQLNEILCVNLLFIACALPVLWVTSSHSTSTGLLLAFILLNASNYLFVIYEQLFLVTKKIWVLMSYRLAECFGAAIVIACVPERVVLVLASLTALRAGTLGITIWYAHKTWAVTPHSSIHIKKLAGVVPISIVILAIAGGRILSPFLGKPMRSKTSKKYQHPSHGKHVHKN